MKRYPRAIFIGSAAALLTVGMVVAGNAYAAPDDAGTVRVTITAPDGIPASVVLSAKSTYVAVKPKAGTSKTVTLPVVAGSYHVLAEPMTIDGRFYVPTSSRPQVPVNAGRVADLKVDYAVDDSFRDFRAGAIDEKSIKLTWTAKPQFTMTVRRTNGFAPAKAPDQGTNVPVSNGTATDTDVQPAARYTYALFAQYRGKWGMTDAFDFYQLSVPEIHGGDPGVYVSVVGT